MDALLVVVAVAGVVALVGFIVVLAKRQAAARREALEAVAQQAGWSFAPDRTGLETLGIGEPFRLLSEGSSHRASNVMRMEERRLRPERGAGGERRDAPPPSESERGWGPASTKNAEQVLIFDHQHTVGSGKNRHTRTQTVVHIRSPRLALPPFVLSPEHAFHKLGGLLGYHDIDFPESPEFSSRYLLRSKEAEDRVRMLFHPAVRLFFEQRPPLTVEGHNEELLIYRGSHRVKPEDLRQWVDDARGISRQLHP
jgi:hypothetical protein